MAKLTVNWKTTGLISVFEEAQKLGFDLRRYDSQHEDVKHLVKKATIDEIMKIIYNAWDESVTDDHKKNWFGSLKNGVYVIAVGGGFGLRYTNGCSEVAYIGRGKISTRLRSHLQNWIFEMSRSLRDVPFRFYMEEFKDARSKDAFKDFEHLLLERFHEKFGEKPLLNKIAGREGNIDHTFQGNPLAPLSNVGKSYLWEVRPSQKNRWFKPVADD